MKNNKMFIYLFVFMFGLLCMSFDDVYALGASNYNTKCEYSFTDHKRKNGTLYVYPSGDKTTFGIGNIEVEFDGQGMHTCDETCEKESRKVFVVENNKLYCPDSAYYCYDGGKNMIVDSKSKCKETPAILSLSSSSGQSASYDAKRSDGSISVCLAGGASKASEFDETLKGYENIITGYLTKLPSSTTEIDKITNEISNISDYDSYCDQTGFNKYNFSTRMTALQKNMKSIYDQLHKNGVINDTEYSQKVIEVNDAFDKKEISLPTTEQVLNCEGLLDDDLQLIIDYALTVIQIAAPILLIILVTVDFAQVVISQDQDAMKKTISKSTKRAIAAIALFFIPLLVKLVLRWAGITDTCGL